MPLALAARSVELVSQLRGPRRTGSASAQIPRTALMGHQRRSVFAAAEDYEYDQEGDRDRDSDDRALKPYPDDDHHRDNHREPQRDRRRDATPLQERWLMIQVNLFHSPSQV